MTRSKHVCVRPATRQVFRGFTLVEVLVAIGVMAIMALMTWRALDGMLRSQRDVQQRADFLQAFRTSLTQWQTDLNRVVDLPGIPAWDWDGKVLRLTRRSVDASASVRVVAWTWRINPARGVGGELQRWQSPPLTRRLEWQDAWALARQWSQTPTQATRTGEVALLPLAGWKLFVHRGGSWSNPLSSDAVTSSRPNDAVDTIRLPDGVRLILDVPPMQGLSEQLVLDWVRPTMSAVMP